MTPDISVVVKRLRDGLRTVALTGAGLSAESGIDCFRDPQGMWARLGAPIVTGSILEALVLHPVQAASFLRELASKLRAAVPNPAHLALTALQSGGALSQIVTQNVDGLHQSSGSDHVIEMHGSLLRRRCDRCSRTAEVEMSQVASDLVEMAEKLESTFVTGPAQLLQRCDCGGLLHADVVEFGQNVHDLHAAQEAMRQADVLLVVGTSGLVQPASGLPRHARDNGAFVVEVDVAPTELSDLADVVIRLPASKALTQISDGVAAAGARS